MFRHLFFLVLAYLIHSHAVAQHSGVSVKDTRTAFNEQARRGDTLSNVLHQMGTFEGHIRSFFMNTVNSKELPDYFALGLGGGLAYYSPIIKRFQVSMSGFIIYNIASSHLGSSNGLTNRYELALFDITNPENHEDLDRLENLYLRYYLTRRLNSFVQVGKFHVSTPLLNLQDSRMRPNLQEGVWLEVNDWEKVKIKSGWIWGTSPRSTIHWARIGESVGIYGAGRSVSGNPARYFGQVDTKGVLISNVEWLNKDLNYQLWNYFVNHLFNVTVQKAEYKTHMGLASMMFGVQYIYERSQSSDKIETDHQYITPNERSHTISGRIAFTNSKADQESSLNYTRITGHGRFLFPREWGTETLYTYNNRERNEGAGDVHAVMLEHIRYLDDHHRLSIRGLGGVYKMPAVENARLNKYSMPSYYHLTLQGRYKFKGFLHGLQGQLLYTYKGNVENDVGANPVYFHNKVDMHHVSLVMDYYF